MTTAKDTSVNAVCFSSSPIPTPPNAPPPTHLSLTFSEAVDLWSHSTLLFHNLEWEQSLTAHRRILRQCGATIRRACLWFNIGVIRGLLGEYFLAAEAFAKALKLEPDFAVGWHCLGISLFQLSDFRKAKRAFDKCLNSFAAEEDTIEYHAQGLDFVLERTRVDWNCRQALFEKNYKQMRAPLPLDMHMGLNRMPAGKLFEPPILETEQLYDTEAFVIASPEKATAPRPIVSDSDKPRKGFRTLLRRRTKPQVKFEHSNPRLLALEETGSDSEFQSEAIVSILAPSAITRSRSTQPVPKKLAPKAVRQNPEADKLFFGSSTWPTISKPVYRLPFVTSKDLAAVQNSSRRSRTATTRTRTRSNPQASASHHPPSVTPSTRGTLAATAYIPTTASVDAFMCTLSPQPSLQHTLPPAVYVPPAHSSDAARKPTTLPSPSSLYSTLFESRTLPSSKSFTSPNPNANPTTTESINATLSRAGTTYPPRWDSLPPHLKPARIHHPDNYQQRPASSIYSPVADHAHTHTHTHAQPKTQPSNPNPNYLRVLNSKTNPTHRFSTATMDSFAIVGMGRTSPITNINTQRWSETESGAVGSGDGILPRSREKKRDITDKDKDKGKGKGRAKWAGLGFHL